MSLEENVKDLTNAVLELTNAIISQTKGISTAPIPTAGPSLQDDAKVQKNSLDDLRAFAGTLVKADQSEGYETAQKILGKFNVKRFDELDTNVYDKVANEFEAAIKKAKPKKAAKNLG